MGNYIVCTIGAAITIATDWWIFIATIGAGIIAGLVTLIAVWYTNKKTIELYEKGRRDEKLKESLVYLKTRFIRTTPHLFATKLINNDIHDNVYVFSGDDGFGFYDSGDYSTKYTMLLSLRNASAKSIHNVIMTVESKLLTKEDSVIGYEFENRIDLLAGNEEILIKMFSDVQVTKAFEGLNQSYSPKLEFVCQIMYLTEGGQEIYHEHTRHMVFHVDVSENGELKSFGIITKKCEDKHEVKEVISSLMQKNIKNWSNSNYRNLQDRIATIRWDRAIAQKGSSHN